MYTATFNPKQFEPTFPLPEPILVGVDARLESPDTLLIQYNEGLFGGGDSLFPMATYGRAHGQQDFDNRAYPESVAFDSPYSQTFPDDDERQQHGSQRGSISTYSDPRQQEQQQQQHQSVVQGLNKMPQPVNQEAFVANHTVSAAVAPSHMSVMPVVLSLEPESGPVNTTIYFNIASRYRLSGYHFSALFGPRVVLAKIIGEIEDEAEVGSGDGGSVAGTTTYALRCQAPENTELPKRTELPEHPKQVKQAEKVENPLQNSGVPVTVLIHGQGGEEIARLAGGTFSYRDYSTSPKGLASRKKTLLPDSHQSSLSTPTTPIAIAGQRPLPQLQETAGDRELSPTEMVSKREPNTKSFPINFPSQNDHVTGGEVAIKVVEEAYRIQDRQPFQQLYHQPQHPHLHPHQYLHQNLRESWGVAVPGSHPEGSTVAEAERIAVPHRVITPPMLVRTTIGSSGKSGSVSESEGGSEYTSIRADMNIMGRLADMTINWSNEECHAKRRLVQFTRTQRGSSIQVSFRTLSAKEQKQQGRSPACVSCIWWAERGECFITSVDTLALLEFLLISPMKFVIDEKNRIRRNLEGFHPFTVAKSRPETERFFKQIMDYGTPKPRNIEKDIKVFPWKILQPALNKIVAKYSVHPRNYSIARSLLMPRGQHHQHQHQHPHQQQLVMVRYPTPGPAMAPTTYGSMQASPASPQPASATTSPHAGIGWFPPGQSYYLQTGRPSTPIVPGRAPSPERSSDGSARWDVHPSASAMTMSSYPGGYHHNNHHVHHSHDSYPHHSYGHEAAQHHPQPPYGLVGGYGPRA